MARGENVTAYLPGDLKAQANEAGIPLSFALRTVVLDVLSAMAGGQMTRTARAVLDEMERRRSATS